MTKRRRNVSLKKRSVIVSVVLDDRVDEEEVGHLLVRRDLGKEEERMNLNWAPSRWVKSFSKLNVTLVSRDMCFPVVSIGRKNPGEGDFQMRT
jgi:hypothetical protein